MTDLLDLMGGTTLYREPPLDEIVWKLKCAVSDGRLRNFTLSDDDKPEKALGQVRGFLKRYRMGLPTKKGTNWLMRNIEAGLNAGVDLIDWEETLEMWAVEKPRDPVAEMWDDFK